MKAGFNLLLWTSHVTDEHFPLIEKLARAGYDGVEVPILEGEPSYYQRVRRVVADNGISCDVVTNMPDALHNPISPDRKLRANALDFMKRVIDCTQSLGADLLCGPFYQPVGLFTGIGPTEDEKKRAVEHARACAEYAGAAGITLAVEFLNRFEAYFLTTMDGVAEHVAAVDMPNFRAMFDTFHANIEEDDPVVSICRHADIITPVHISETNRGVPGRGHNNWAGIFKALRSAGYNNWLTIEAFGRVLPAFAAATKIWRDMYESPEVLYTEGIGFIHRMWSAA
ncbi:MAG TPA: sugar phosphate isomerase/epimerase family protein [Spirochaetia bacterium]|nr:sugar phosphate isomerase/epimerase family protein [Spirochaetia bacterium]